MCRPEAGEYRITGAVEGTHVRYFPSRCEAQLWVAWKVKQQGGGVVWATQIVELSTWREMLHGPVVVRSGQGRPFLDSPRLMVWSLVGTVGLVALPFIAYIGR